ncbi:MAG: acetylglutamate kinase [Acidobacteria bacterium]|nr:acetylglutamate kinase [Acidobacteriota bacterium]
MTTILKLGGELLEDAAAVRVAAAAILRLARNGPVAVVHGAGRAIDAELRSRGQSPCFVDGLRVTDASALDAVVCVLAGRLNTTLVAAIGASGGRAVGLTGADGGIGIARKSPPFTRVSGAVEDLGLVGIPDGRDAALLADLLRLGYIPVVASVGVDRSGSLLNVNADALAAHLAVVLPASRLVIAGGTSGVLGPDGRSIASLTVEEARSMTMVGTAHSGMVAKLAACMHAAEQGVAEVMIVGGRNVDDFDTAEGTRIAVARGTSLLGIRYAAPAS